MENSENDSVSLVDISNIEPEVIWQEFPINNIKNSKSKTEYLLFQ